MITQIATIAGAAQWTGGVPTDVNGRLMDFQPTVVGTNGRGQDWAPVIFGWNYNTAGTTAHEVYLNLEPVGSTDNLDVPLYNSDATDAATLGIQFAQKGGQSGCIVVPIFSATPYRITLLTVGKAQTSSLTLWWAWRQVG